LTGCGWDQANGVTMQMRRPIAAILVPLVLDPQAR
jgi:hypothetical protein